MSRKKIAIIGGGSSGLFLASLLNCTDMEVCLIEKNNKLGKKILASGNGKCNFTNTESFKNKYNNQFANMILNKFSVEDTLMEFKRKGLIYKSDDQGRCYPVSECAASVLDCLKRGLNNTRILLDTEVKSIRRFSDKYQVEYGEKKDVFDYVVCCSGSVASNLGSEKAYQYLKFLDVDITQLRPSLSPIIVREDVSSLKGVRIKGKLDLIDGKNNACYSENGEVLFKEDSLSGIAVFNASSVINRAKDNYKIVLDISSNVSEKELKKYIEERKDDVSSLFKGFLNDKIADFIIKRCGIKGKCLTVEDINKLITNIYSLSFEVKGLYPLKESQVCSGGVELSQINDNLELKKYPGVYVAGELLDIDGMCGGYNLQFAWSCAGVIAEHIRKR